MIQGEPVPEGQDPGGWASAIEKVVGCRPDGCPWRAFYDEDVAEITQAYEWFSKGQLSAWTDDPPNALIEGLNVFHGALERARAHDAEALRKRGK